MVVSFTASNVSPAPPFSNRFQPLEGLAHEEETTKPHSEFQAQGVYKPPHMRIPSESAASSTGSDPTASTAPGVRPTHGSSLDHQKGGASHPHTPHVSSAPGSAVFEFDEVKKRIEEEVLAARKAMTELEMVDKELLEEKARFEQHVQVLRDAGYTSEEIRKIAGWSSANSPSRPPSTEPFDVKVSIRFRVLVSEGDLPWVRQCLEEDLARFTLGSEREVERLEEAHEKKTVQQIGKDLRDKTPTPGGPMYSSVSHPRGVHQTGKYGNSTPSMTPANNAHRGTSVHHPTGWNDQVQTYSGVAGHHGSIPSATLQVPNQIYQTTPGRGFNASANSVPPRFRQQPIYYQPPLHCQNVIPNGPGDTFSIGHPVSWLPVPNQPQNPALNRTFWQGPMPPLPPPYFHEAVFASDLQKAAALSGCNPDHFVKTYCEMNGFSPSQGPWTAGGGAVEKMEHATQEGESRKMVEQGTKERYGAGSRLRRWCPKLSEEPIHSEPGYSSSSSNASTKATSSRNSAAGDGGSMTVGIFGKPEIRVPRIEKPWKNIEDATWLFRGPPRPDDPEHYMTHIAEKMGRQVRDLRPE